MDMGYMKAIKLFYHPKRVEAYLKNKVIKPITVKMYLTEKCNLRCNYCVFADRFSNNELSFNKIKIILSKLKQMGVKAITLTGGEPTCSKHFNEFAEYASKNFDLGLITNGVIYPYSLKYFKWVRVSLDTCNSETYKEIKGSDQYFKVIGNIEKMVEEKKRKNFDTTIGMQMVVTNNNYDEITKFVEFSESYNVDYCQIRPVENMAYVESVLYSIKKQLKAIESKAYNISVLTTKYKWNELENNYRKSYYGCPGAEFIGAISAKGDFYICCTWVKHKDAKYGSILYDDVDKLLNNRDNILKNFDFTKCPVCCQGTLINKALMEFNNVKHKNFI